ncbi:MAG: FHA domain-containing protein [Luminiphilus sp.]
MSKLRGFFAELVRRQMFRTVGAYIVIIWGLAQGLAGLFPIFGVPDWVLRSFVYASIAATPLVVILAWKYQFTMQGLVRDPEDEEAELDGTGLLNRARTKHDTLGISPITVSWQSEGEATQQVETSQPIVIGRDTGCDIVVLNPHVSRSHAVIWAHNSAWYVTDLKSANGTWLGGSSIQESVLRDNDVLTLDQDGPQLTFRVEDTDVTVVSPAGL